MVKLQGAENQIIIDYQVYEKRPSLAGGRRGFVLTGVEAGVAGNQTSHPSQLRVRRPTHLWRVQLYGRTSNFAPESN